MQLIISLFGFLVALLLILNIKKSIRSNIYLVSFLLLINLFNIINYSTMFSENPYLGVVFLVHFQPIIVLTGPMLFFYVRGVLTDEYSFRRRDWIHFIPSILYLINCSRYYIKPFSEKLLFAQNVILSRNTMLHFEPILFSGNVSYIGRSMIALFYTVVCVIMIYRHFKEDFRHHFQNALIFRWLILLLAFNFLMNIGIVYSVAQLLYHWKFNEGLTVVPIGTFLFGLASLIVINLVLFFFQIFFMVYHEWITLLGKGRQT